MADKNDRDRLAGDAKRDPLTGAPGAYPVGVGVGVGAAGGADGNKNKLSWDRAREATRDAWHRVEKAMPGDADNDGY